MNFKQENINGQGIRFSIIVDGSEVGRSYLYILRNDLHQAPFGFIEDLFIDRGMRGKGIGKRLIKKMIEEARKKQCYKVLLTSRYSAKKLHKFYENLGFKDYGIEFRLDF